MSTTGCPLNQTITTLEGMLKRGRLTQPRARRIVEEILALFRDTAWGRAGEGHLAAIEELAQELTGDGMDVNSQAAARTVTEAFGEHREVFVSHVETGHCVTGDCVRLSPAPCQMTCPSGIDIPSYLSLIGQGRDAEAIEVIRKDNPFPWICGLICTRPCELMCVRARIDTPVSIKFLKAFAAEKALSERRYVNPPKAADKHQKVCVVGAGPAGMTAAYYLALKGYGVTVLEALPMAGGMMMVGIPRYRLPREVIDREVAMIEDLGVEFRFNTRFGQDITFDQLKADGYDAFFFAIGAHKTWKLNIPGESDFPQVIEAIDLLQKVALGERHMPGKRVAIVGGGNVAIDAARTCVRLGSEAVTLLYRRTRSEMPADVEEVEQAEEEGVNFSFLAIPTAINGSDGKLTSLTCLKAKLGPEDASGRRRPVPMEGSDHELDVDAVIPAIGQRVNYECMEELADLGWSRRNTIRVNRASMETSLAGVFAAGDAVLGPATVVEAIGGGKKAADAIDRYLSGIPQPKMPPIPVRRLRTEWFDVPSATKMILKRPEMPLLNIERRLTTFQQVELGYTENMAREEARRCLRCDICRRCGICVEVCRDKMGINALQLGYFDFDHPVETDFRQIEERCILCGACAENCPNNAMVIEDRKDERLLSLCGTILNRQKLVHCESCGKVMGPAKYLDYVHKKIGGVARNTFDHILCDACARKKTAGSKVPPVMH
ncbi:MAG: FAD-dependent oxidoreductase [Desulfobacterales bacterium]